MTDGTLELSRNGRLVLPSLARRDVRHSSLSKKRHLKMSCFTRSCWMRFFFRCSVSYMIKTGAANNESRKTVRVSNGVSSCTAQTRLCNRPYLFFIIIKLQRPFVRPSVRPPFVRPSVKWIDNCYHRPTSWSL